MHRASLVGKSTKPEMFVSHPSKDVKLYSKKKKNRNKKTKRENILVVPNVESAQEFLENNFQHCNRPRKQSKLKQEISGNLQDQCLFRGKKMK